MHADESRQSSLPANNLARTLDRVCIHGGTIARLYREIKPRYTRKRIALLYMWSTQEEAERLARRFEKVDNRAQFARDFKVPGGGAMIYQHINGLKPISLDAGIAYATGFGCSLDEISPRLAAEARKADKVVLPSSHKVLRLADTPNQVSGVQSFADNNTKPAHGRVGRVPLISLVQAGAFAEAMDMHAVGDAEEWVSTTKPVKAHTFALRVVGDSMVSDDPREKSFPEGMILIVEPDADPLPGKFVIAKNGGDATFKQLVKDGPDWYLKPLNKRYPMKPLGNAQIIGVVVQATFDDI